MNTNFSYGPQTVSIGFEKGVIELLTSQRPEPIRKICARVCAEAGISLRELRGYNRQRRYAWPRQEAMRRAIKAGFSTPQVGKFLNRDHTTVIHGAKAAEKRGQVDWETL